MEPQGDQESPGALEVLVSLERRDRQDETASQDRQESRENQVFLVLVALVPQVFQVYQVQRETLVCPGHLVPLGSRVPKERLVSLVTPVLQDPQVLPALLVFLCRGPKDCRELLDLPDEQGLPVLRVLVVPEALVE